MLTIRLFQDAKTHLMRACAVLVFHLVTQAKVHASEKGKTVSIEDVLVDLKTDGFESIHEAISENTFYLYRVRCLWNMTVSAAHAFE